MRQNSHSTLIYHCFCMGREASREDLSSLLGCVEGGFQHTQEV